MQVPVVYDFRANDMLHGGQGAPLAPVYHEIMAKEICQRTKIEMPLVIVNIGGIANVTIIERDRPLIAYDCGPGNALIDQWVHEKCGVWYDEDGKIASQGQVIGCQRLGKLLGEENRILPFKTSLNACFRSCPF